VQQHATPARQNLTGANTSGAAVPSATVEIPEVLIVHRVKSCGDRRESFGNREDLVGIITDVWMRHFHVIIASSCVLHEIHIRVTNMKQEV
jgi:hypothetical protein